MSNLMAGSIGGYFSDSQIPKLRIVSLLLNNVCNLACKHCYLEAPKYPEPHLNHDEWLRFFISLLSDVKPEVLCFAGKEVFAQAESAATFFETISLRNRLQNGRETRIGIVTNGTLISRYRDQIVNTRPDYWDISVDGLPGTHNAIRGKNAFEKLKPNLTWLIKEFPEKIWLTHTVLNENLSQLPHFIEYFHKFFNVKNFSIGFYRTFSYTDQTQNLNKEQFEYFAHEVIPVLSRLVPNDEVMVRMEFDPFQPDLLDAVTEAGWADPQKPLSATEHNLGNGITLRMDAIRIPVGFWRSVRVTPEGYWLAAEDLVRVDEYDKVAAGTIREHRYDARALFQAGLRKISEPLSQKADIAIAA